MTHEAFALEEPEGPAWRQGVVGRHQKTNGDYGFAPRRKFVHPVQRDLATPRQDVSGYRLIAEVEKAPVTRDERPAPSALLGSQQSKARPKLVHPLTVSSNRPSASLPHGDFGSPALYDVDEPTSSAFRTVRVDPSLRGGATAAAPPQSHQEGGKKRAVPRGRERLSDSVVFS